MWQRGRLVVTYFLFPAWSSYVQPGFFCQQVCVIEDSNAQLPLRLPVADHASFPLVSLVSQCSYVRCEFNATSAAWCDACHDGGHLIMPEELLQQGSYGSCVEGAKAALRSSPALKTERCLSAEKMRTQLISDLEECAQRGAHLTDGGQRRRRR